MAMVELSGGPLDGTQVDAAQGQLELSVCAIRKRWEYDNTGAMYWQPTAKRASAEIEATYKLEGGLFRHSRTEKFCI